MWIIFSVPHGGRGNTALIGTGGRGKGASLYIVGYKCGLLPETLFSPWDCALASTSLPLAALQDSLQPYFLLLVTCTLSFLQVHNSLTHAILLAPIPYNLPIGIGIQ